MDKELKRILLEAASFCLKTISNAIDEMLKEEESEA